MTKPTEHPAELEQLRKRVAVLERIVEAARDYIETCDSFECIPYWPSKEYDPKRFDVCAKCKYTILEQALTQVEGKAL